MSDISYPDKYSLVWWVEDLQGTDPLLKLALPLIDEDWYARILDILERAKLSFEPCTLHRKAATIFYNIAKGHEYVDGNKRSSIVVLYLFYLVNSHYLPRSVNIKDWAKRIARSHGRARRDTWIEQLEKELAEKVRPLNLDNK